MTSWVQVMRGAGLVVVLGAGGVVPAAGTATAYGLQAAANPSPGASHGPAHSHAPDHSPGHSPSHAPAHRPSRSPAHVPPHAPTRSPKHSPSPSPSAAEPSRAGSVAGEGRQRPGRREEPTWQDERQHRDEDAEVPGTPADEAAGQDDPATAVPSRVPTAPSTSAPRPAPHTVTQGAQPAARALWILPLGTGLILVGLGLGLAFFALRLRRG